MKTIENNKDLEEFLSQKIADYFYSEHNNTFSYYTLDDMGNRKNIKMSKAIY